MTTEVSFPPGKHYGMTVMQNIAMSNDYIGEQLLTINPLSNAVSFALHGAFMPPTMMYYFGVPDDRLKKLFGVDDAT